jgi:cytochrome c556
LRYVHLPHGYDGISAARAAELAKAVRDLPGPVYIHCHHGKHRSPAAAVVACISTGLLPPESALTVLETAGTSENYRGLYESASSARRMDDATLDALQVEFPESARLPAIAEAMIPIDHAHDHLKLFAANDWKRLADKPDLDAPHEALLLREHFTELLRMPAVVQETSEFRQLATDSEAAAVSLESHLRAGRQQKAAKSLELVTHKCTACHRSFRDVPLSVKKPSAK